MHPTFTAFAGSRCLATGDLVSVALAAKAAPDVGSILVFADATGQPVDLDLRGDADEIRARLAEAPAAKPARGRPRLGVVAREVTLLPEHWIWLQGQPGGASATLRRLVEQARRSTADATRRRRAQEATHRVMTALAGDMPGYEEALRALYAGEAEAFGRRLEDWPADISRYVSRLAGEGAFPVAKGRGAES